MTRQRNILEAPLSYWDSKGSIPDLESLVGSDLRLERVRVLCRLASSQRFAPSSQDPGGSRYCRRLIVAWTIVHTPPRPGEH